MSDADAQIGSALRAGDLPQAMALAEAALAAGQKSPQILHLAAYRLELAGRYDEALDRLDEALQFAPRDPRILNNIGICHSKAARPVEALAAFEAAIAARPDFAPAHHGVGLSLAAMGDNERAFAAHARAAGLDPRFAEPVGAMGAMFAESGHWAEAERHAQRALALDPACSTAAVTLAQAQKRKGDLQGAEQRFRQLLDDAAVPPLHRAAALSGLAETLEAVERPSEAIDAYIAANEAFRREPLAAMKRAGSELGVEMCARLHDYFQRADRAAWRCTGSAAQAGASQHVFLVGFPRSGTTLLEQVLASHSDVVTLEEKNTLDDVFQGYFQTNDGLDRLSNLSAEDEGRLREEYWQRVSAHGVDVSGKVFVDKQPLYTLLIPAIAKLFPQARIVMARRDPRDVVLSCFRNRFRANPLLIEFTDLERTARLYDGVMRLAELFETKFALPTHGLRHESLIEDFDTEVGNLCSFLGIAFDARMREFAKTARERDIRTPSADQVRRGLNSEGVARWKRYGPAVEAILPILEPWIVKYGYKNA